MRVILDTNILIGALLTTATPPLRGLAELIDPLPRVEASPDPNDDFLLALARAGDADFLVTGDRGGLSNLAHHGRTQIVTARPLADRPSAMPPS